MTARLVVASTRIVLLGDPLKDLNKNLYPAPYMGKVANSRASQAKMRRLIGEWQRKMQAAWQKAGQPRFTAKVEATWIVYRGRKLDPDNAQASLKHCFDALTDRHEKTPRGTMMLPDDSDQWIEYRPILQFTSRTWAENPRVELCLLEKKAGL